MLSNTYHHKQNYKNLFPLLFVNGTQQKLHSEVFISYTIKDTNFFFFFEFYIISNFVYIYRNL